MILLDIDSRLNPLKTTNNMKYLVFIVLALIIFCLCLPIWIITWDWDYRTNGWGHFRDGFEDMFGIDW